MLLQISFEETATTGPVTLVEGDFKVQHEHLVLGYLSRKFGPASVSPEAAALSDTLIYEASQPVCLPYIHQQLFTSFNVLILQVTAEWLQRVETLLASSKTAGQLLGAAFTPADAAVYVALANSAVTIDATKYPKVAAFVAAVASRPNLSK